MCKITLVEHLYLLIKDAGVDRMFGVPGDFSLGMLDVLESTQILKWVG